MINKIGNWVFGSFFRTIGRLLVFVLLGFIIANLVDFSDIISNFRITDLFFEKVNASVLTENVKYFETSYLATGQPSSTGWTNSDGMFYRNVHPTPNEQIFSIGISSNDVVTTNADYIQMSFSVEQPLSADATNYLNMGRCSQFDCSQYTSDGVCSRYYCSALSPITSIGSVTTFDTTTITNMNFIVTANYTGGWSTCSIEGNSIFCPTLKRQLQSIDFHVNFDTLMDTYFKLSMHRSVTKYIYANQEIIDTINETSQQQMQQQQQQHEEMMDSNTTEAEDEAGDFLGNFTVEDTGGLNAIITAPLATIQSLLNNTCTKLVLPLPFVDKNLELPCLYPIYNDYFGAFFTIYQTIILGIISYRCIKSLFFDVKGFTNPEDDRIEVMDL